MPLPLINIQLFDFDPWVSLEDERESSIPLRDGKMAIVLFIEDDVEC